MTFAQALIAKKWHEVLKQFEFAAFPRFIGMPHGTTVQKFSSIEIDEKQQSLGILKFMRDAFLSDIERYSGKTTLIDRLIGPNDLRIMTELKTAFKQLEEEVKNFNEELLATVPIDRRLNLENIICMSRDDGMSVSFILKNRAWLYEYNPQLQQKALWNFKPLRITREQYNATYNNYAKQALEAENTHPLIYPQKTLIEVLKIKAARIKAEK
jgi:hypothetical protein